MTSLVCVFSCILFTQRHHNCEAEVQHGGGADHDSPKGWGKVSDADSLSVFSFDFDEIHKSTPFDFLLVYLSKIYA